MIKNKVLFSTKNNFFFGLSIALGILYTLSLFFNLGLAPFYNEEPRRAIVALEMLFKNNYIVTTLFNETWYDHPPLWNIILAFSARIFGIDDEFSFRFPSALSLLLTGILVYYMSKKYVGKKFGILSAFFYLTSADLYFYFSGTAEIDIFFSLLVFISMLCIFYFHDKQNYTLLFLSTYFFSTLAFFTKGIVAYVFLGISLCVYFILKKQFKKLFLPIHLASFILSIGSVILYFFVYNKYENAWQYLEGMWGLTEKKSLLNTGLAGMIKHIFIFPLNLLINLFPATFFVFYFLKKDSINLIKSNSYIHFLFILFISNITIYIISPGANARYTYMLYPMCITILVYLFYTKKDDLTRINKVFFVGMGSLILILSIICFVIPFIDFFDPIKNYKYFIIFIGLLYCMIFILQKKSTDTLHKCLYIIFSLILTKFLFALTFLPMKKEHSSSTTNKIIAKEILSLTGNEPIFVLSTESINEHEDIPFNFYKTGVYIEMNGNKILQKVPNLTKKGYYILNKNNITNQTVLLSFKEKQETLVLIKY